MHEPSHRLRRGLPPGRRAVALLTGWARWTARGYVAWWWYRLKSCTATSLTDVRTSTPGAQGGPGTPVEVAMSAQTFRDALAEEEAAERAIYNGDPEPYKALWSHAGQVTLLGAFGPCKTGWAELSRTFDWVAHRYQGGTVSPGVPGHRRGRGPCLHRRPRARLCRPRRWASTLPDNPRHPDLPAAGWAVATRPSPRRLRTARREPTGCWVKRGTTSRVTATTTATPVDARGPR